MKISHRGGPKITFSYPFVHLYKSYNSSKVPAMPCHESSLMILTAPHKAGRMDTAERGPHAHRGEVGEGGGGGGGPRGRGEVGEARRVCQARAICMPPRRGRPRGCRGDRWVAVLEADKASREVEPARDLPACRQNWLPPRCTGALVTT